MKILAVDNEEIALRGLCKAIKQALPDAEIFSTQNSSEALSMALHCEPAVAFLDIEMPKVNGLELAKQLKKEVNPKINIIFTTGYNEYIVEAFTKLRVSGYLMKPITKDMILDEIDNLRYPQELKWEGRIKARCFGSFELYVDELPVMFHYNKTKELCAYLIDHGGMCSIGELQDKLWEDDHKASEHKSYLQNMISDLNKTLIDLGCNDIVLRKYGSIGIDSNKIDCDYYAYIQGNPAAINAFRGEYMSQYSWAEKTLATLVFTE